MNESTVTTDVGQVNGAENGALATGADTAKETGTEKFTQADVDRRVQEALKTAKSKWKGEMDVKLEEAKSEGARLAKLSAEERQREEANAEREKFEREKAEFEQKSLIAEAVKQLGEKELPVELSQMVAGKSAEEAQANIKTLEEVWSKAVEKAVNARLRSKAPNVGDRASTDMGSGFFDVIRQNQRF